MTSGIDQVGGADGVDQRRTAGGQEAGDRDETDGTTVAGGAATAGAVAGDQPGEPTDGAAGDAGAGPPGSAAGLAGLITLAVLPLAVAAVALRSPRWYPLVDMAQIEMRIRDVGPDHLPLVGVPGRFFGHGQPGNHPGPLFFYALAPVYRLLGSTAWALEVSCAVVSAVATGLSVWMARRRAGTAGAVVAVAGLAVLGWSYGPAVLTHPWNPFVAALWWTVLLLAVWSALEGDLPMLVVAAAAGSLCAQSHAGYLGLVGGLAALLLAAGVVSAVRAPAQRRRLAVWGAAALATGLVLWLPPLYQQVRDDPGNLSILAESFQNPEEEPPGLLDGSVWWLQLHDPTQLVTDDEATGLGTMGGGVALLMVWGAAAAVSVRRRDRYRWLHLVAGAGLLLGLLSVARLSSLPFYYLTLWARGTTALALVAAGATVASALADARRRQGRALPGWTRPAALAAAAVPVVAFLGSAARADAPDDGLSAVMAELSGPTVEAVAAGDGAATGPDGRYLVTWSDPTRLGSTGYGLLLELERQGYDVGAPRGAGFERPVGEHRTIDPAATDAEIHVAVGDTDVDTWRARDDAEELAVVDERTPAERAESRDLIDRIHARLAEEGLDDLSALFDTSRINAVISGRMPEDLFPLVDRLNEIGDPTAVFLAPSGETTVATGTGGM